MEYLAIIWVGVEPHLPEIMGLIVTAAVSVGAASLRKWTGVQIEEKDMRVLHEALKTGAVIAAKGDAKRALGSMVEIAMTHAMESAPDAVARLNPSAGVLRRIAERKVREAIE